MGKGESVGELPTLVTHIGYVEEGTEYIFLNLLTFKTFFLSQDLRQHSKKRCFAGEDLGYIRFRSVVFSLK